MGVDPAAGIAYSPSSKLAQAAEHMQRNRREHLAAGGKSAVTFIERFFFEEEELCGVGRVPWVYLY